MAVLYRPIRAMDAEDIVTHQIRYHRVATYVPNDKEAAA